MMNRREQVLSLTQASSVPTLRRARPLKPLLFFLAAVAVAAMAAGCGDVLSIEPEPKQNGEPGPVFSQRHGLQTEPFELTIFPSTAARTSASAGTSATASTSASATPGAIYYTLDGSEPTARSSSYKAPLRIDRTTILRAIEIYPDGSCTKVTTASYLFDDILDLDSTPEGYPEYWGPYIELEGRAKADYAMDPRMTRDPALREKMKAGLRQIPVVSIVTDKGNLFNDSEDPATGGIYIHTGAPVGDGIGRGWERPVSLEIFDGGSLDVTVDCGLRIHGGHSRLAEKNPKHAFRLKFKDEYGPKKLECAVFGAGGPKEFNALTLRTFYNNSWQHIDGTQRSRAQYVRDLWHRKASAKLGMPYSEGRHVHLFLNGMYWGIYSLSEKIDDSWCKTHYGGKKSDYDVLKPDESQGNAVTADCGDMTAYSELVAAVGKVEEAGGYEVVEQLLDIGNFIDFIILNQYGGNTDWDYHNWYAIRNKAGDGKIRFAVWDSECIFGSVDDNILELNNSGKPTGMFRKLMKNPAFRQSFAHRVGELSGPGGLLTAESSTALWDSLYHSIDMALYCEAARWGDYRNAVHPYYSQGQRYDVDNWYMAERSRILTDYFPKRLTAYLQQLHGKDWYPADRARAARH